MSALIRLAVFLACVLLGGALVSPWVWRGAQFAAATLDTATWRGLAAHPFHRYVHRCLLVLALAGLWPLARGWGCRTWTAVGLTADRRALLLVLRGVAWGVMLVALVTGFEWLSGLRGARAGYPGGRLAFDLIRAAGSAAVVALIEELLFRGVICGGVRRQTGWTMAAAVSSAVYAMVHFFRRPAAPESVTAWSGFEALGGMLAGFAAWRDLVPDFATLFLFGWLLAWSLRRSGSLYFAIGMHAGAVFASKMRGVLTEATSGAEGSAFAGWIPLVVVAATLGVYTRAGGRRRVPEEAPMASPVSRRNPTHSSREVG